MVCFRIHLCFPPSKRESSNSALQSRIEHIIRHSNASITGFIEYRGIQEYQISICDEETVALLRDLPTPFAVSNIDILHSNINLYKHRQHQSPPRIPLLQNIYWLAKSTERWQTPISHELSQTK